MWLFLDPFFRLRRGEISVFTVMLPYVATGACAWLLSRLLPGLRSLRLPWLVAIAILAAMAGLILTGVTYGCSSCQPYQPGCWVRVQGWPMRQGVFDVDPEPVTVYDVCRIGGDPSATAAAVNFAIPALGLPLLVAFVRSRRLRRRDGGDP